MKKSNLFVRAAAQFLSASLFVSVAACAPGAGPDEPVVEPDPAPNGSYTPAMLNQYRAVLPSHEMLDAPAPTATVNAVIGNPATYPAMATPQIVAVNETLTSIIDLLVEVTALEPSLYNSETKEFIWGPFNNDDSSLEGDEVLVYIQDAPEGADFDFHYAFIRVNGNDVADWTPVIWGGVNPDADDPDSYGNGVLLYDFEANADFEMANDATRTRDEFAQGRFAIAYMRQADNDVANTDVTAVVSVFRNFSEPGQTAMNFDQLYGRVENFDDGNIVDFANIEASVNIDEGEVGKESLEDISLRLAFFNRGRGRAEAVVVGGDLDSDTGESELSAVECWDDVLARSFYEVTLSGELAGEEPITVETEGQLSDCGFFASTLDALDIPDLSDLDGDLLDALSEVASNGLDD